MAQAHQFGDPPYKAAITVCPLMWNDPLYFGGDTIADAASSGRASNFDQLLVKTQPQSAVLLHEMFHLSSGDFSNTKDRACKYRSPSCAYVEIAVCLQLHA